MNVSPINVFKSQSFTSNYPVNGREMSNQGSDYVYPVEIIEVPQKNKGTKVSKATKTICCEDCQPRIHWQNVGDGVLVPIIIKE